ncbi:hypothetical protein [Pseudonocardia sp. NPDC049635]|uniref:hypothetical protein n=1 Tax=Pseudonocardia sp. NPDC049635 TaxID=3155506 RepID=UPI0033DA9B7F
MAGAGYSGAGSIHALLAKFTALDATGAPLGGDDNVFWTDSLIKVGLGLTLNEPEAVKQTNGSGVTCMVFQAPKTIDSMEVSEFSFCTPDPRNTEFLAGGEIILGTGDQAQQAIGYAAPKVGAAPKPNGVAVELWSRAVAGGSQIGYMHWLLPRLSLVQSSDGFELGAENPLTPTFNGSGAENINFGAGADGTWTWVSDRVYQWVLEESLPEYTPGYETVELDSGSG